jgi:hypothetical protein
MSEKVWCMRISSPLENSTWKGPKSDGVSGFIFFLGFGLSKGLGEGSMTLGVNLAVNLANPSGRFLSGLAHNKISGGDYLSKVSAEIVCASITDYGFAYVGMNPANRSIVLWKFSFHFLSWFCVLRS